MIVVRAPRLKLLILIVLDVGMVAASAWLARSHAVPPVTELVGWTGIVFFGLCGGWILSRLFSHRISLALDRNGLLDNSSALPAGKIPWDQISRLGITTLQHQRFLGIDVRDRAPGSDLRRKLDDANIGLAGYPIYIASTSVDRTLEELHDLIAKYWKDPKVRAELGAFD
jgi:hypothetical protein